MSSSLRDLISSAALGMNLLSWFTTPKKQRTPDTSVGACILCTAFTLCGSALIPELSMSCPRNVTRENKNWHLLLSRERPVFLKVLKQFHKLIIMLFLCASIYKHDIHHKYSALTIHEYPWYPSLEMLWG